MRISDWSSDVCSSDLLDCLVNNAAGNFLARSETLSPRAVDAVLAVVLHGTAYVTLACGQRWLAEERAGTVLSIVATYAETGSPYVVPSAMAKARSEEHTSELQSLMRISYAVFCLNKKKVRNTPHQ